jgi:uncharacterized Fe-S center protein
MGIISKVKQSLGFGQQTSLEEAKKTLSETYPDTPSGTYRCGRCEEVLPVHAIGNTGLGRNENDEMEAITICPDCTESSTSSE